MLSFSKYAVRVAVTCALVLSICQIGFAQKAKSKTKAKPVAASRVTQIDIEGLRKLLKPNGKPLLINFWATWCDPCREEFPDLVKLDAAYKGRIDFLTVSFDDLADIRTSVPKFLSGMKAQMPAFLLKTPDEGAAIEMISKDWEGNLPLTILFNPDGTTAYMRKGKIWPAMVTAEIDKVLAPPLAK